MISLDIIEKWLKGWSLSRKLPLPVKYKSGFKVNVGYEKQKVRYVFPEVNDDFVELANSLNEPWSFLKVCSSADELKKVIPEKWVIQPQGYMMTCFSPMDIKNVDLRDEYRLEQQEYKSTYVLKIVTKNGEQAAIGRIVFVDDVAVYDRISTEVNHRRMGLATVLMRELEKIAFSKGISKNILVATEEGISLYQSLGWKLGCLYTSIVIPVDP